MIRRVILATDLSASSDRAMEREDLVRKHFRAMALGSHCDSQVAAAGGDAGAVLAGFDERNPARHER